MPTNMQAWTEFMLFTAVDLSRQVPSADVIYNQYCCSGVLGLILHLTIKLDCYYRNITDQDILKIIIIILSYKYNKDSFDLDFIA